MIEYTPISRIEALKACIKRAEEELIALDTLMQFTPDVPLNAPMRQGLQHQHYAANIQYNQMYAALMVMTQEKQG